MCPSIFFVTKTLSAGEKRPPGANMKAVFGLLAARRVKSRSLAAPKRIRWLSCVCFCSILDACFAFQEVFKPILFVRKKVSPPLFRSNHLGPFGGICIFPEPATIPAGGCYSMMLGRRRSVCDFVGAVLVAFSRALLGGALPGFIKR